MARQFKVTYLDDSEPTTVAVGARAAIEVERKWKGAAPLLEGTLFGVWVAMGKPCPFEEFLDSVDDVDFLDQSDDAAPSLPAAGDAS